MYKIKSEFLLLNELLYNLTVLHTLTSQKDNAKPKPGLMYIVPNTKPSLIYTVPNAKPSVEFFFCLFPFLFSSSSYLACLGLV